MRRNNWLKKLAGLTVSGMLALSMAGCSEKAATPSSGDSTTPSTEAKASGDSVTVGIDRKSVV